MLFNIISETFLQLRKIINQLSKDEFSEKLELLNHVSVGQHVRHILEFYICLSQGIKSGVVNYDRRARNLAIENEPNYAIMILEELTDIFCCHEMEQKSIINVIEFNGVIVESKSSLNRELIYLIEHSIHHYAIIGIALKNQFTKVDIPHNFGIAYSTANHHQNTASDIYHNQH